MSAYLNDMILIESELRAAARVQRSSGTYDPLPAARVWMDSLIDTTGKHLEALTGAHDQAGGVLTAHRTGMGSLIGWTTGLIDRARLEHQASRSIRDLTVGLHMACTSYEMLAVISTATETPAVRELAIAHLRDCVHLVGEGESQVLQAALTELAADGVAVDGSRLDVCLGEIEQAWEPRSVIDAPADPGVRGEGDPQADLRYRLRASAFARSNRVEPAARRASEALQGEEADELRRAASRARAGVTGS